jgi:hypothetical protein
VGTPKGWLTRLRKHLDDKPWQEAPGLPVKLLPQGGELSQSRDRVAKERAMRREAEAAVARLKKLSVITVTLEELLMERGAARDRSRAVWPIWPIFHQLQPRIECPLLHRLPGL